MLQAVVAAVDAASTQPETTGATLRTHVMRASDGSHYVAFSIAPPASQPLPSGPVLLYVRLATRVSSSVRATPERSALREWLAGNRTAAPPITTRGIAVGEMPVMGPTADLRRPVAVSGSNDLQLIALERQRAREREEERAQQRRAELEGKAAAATEMLPFEDFDVASQVVTANGARMIQRAITAGPGDYALYVGWADPAAPNPTSTVRVVKTPISLPTATNALSISSIIIADGVRGRSSPYSPQEQAAHPYALGLTEVTPAADAVFAPDESLGVAFQVIGARPSDTGKPQLEIAFRVVRVAAGQEQPVASLKPQSYSEASLPPDFDLRLGHPLLAAISAPLATLSRGAYRLKITVDDRHAGRTATADADFTVAATAASLLKEAPAFSPPFRREAFLGAEVLAYLTRSLRPASPSPALERALGVVSAGRFIELGDEPFAKGEEGVRAALTGLAQLSLGDVLSAVQFQRAQLLGAPLAPARLLTGAARAQQGRDPDAIAAWDEAVAAGAPGALVAPFLLDAYVRRGDYARAAALLEQTAVPPATATWVHGAAATRIATRNEAVAIALLDGHLAKQPQDDVAQWLLLHALYSQFVAGDTATRVRVATLARTYVDRTGTHAELAREWLKIVESDK